MFHHSFEKRTYILNYNYIVKIRMLVQMQKMAVVLLKAQGKEARVWKIGGKGGEDQDARIKS